MFQRAEPRKFHQKCREALWPSMGWKRTALYYKHRVGRMQGSPYSISAGVASGVAVSFTPFIGLHLILAGVLAKLLRASIPAALLGTLIGNPSTFPFIWVGILKIGQFVLGHDMVADGGLEHLTFDMVFTDPEKLFWPMLIGGIPCAIAAWVVTYYLLRDQVRRYQKRRMKKLRAALLREFNRDRRKQRIRIRLRRKRKPIPKLAVPAEPQNNTEETTS